MRQKQGYNSWRLFFPFALLLGVIHPQLLTEFVHLTSFSSHGDLLSLKSLTAVMIPGGGGGVNIWERLPPSLTELHISRNNVEFTRAVEKIEPLNLRHLRKVSVPFMPPLVHEHGVPIESLELEVISYSKRFLLKSDVFNYWSSR